MLGLYKIPMDGCEYSVRAKLKFGPSQVLEQRKMDVSEAKSNSGPIGWLKGDFHVHSVHSDGDASVIQVAQVAVRRGLDFIAITDHNTISQLRDFSEASQNDVILILGEEVTTYYGHMNALGLSEWVDFRVRKVVEAKELIGSVKAREWLSVINL